MLRTPTPGSRAIRVLLVEDNDDDAFLITRALGASGHWLEVVHATRLLEALEVAESAHLVLLDLNLPDSGVLTSLAAIGTVFGDIPVIALTGDDDAATIGRAVAAGAQDFLVKGSFDSPMLARRIVLAIERFASSRVRSRTTRAPASMKET